MSLDRILQTLEIEAERQVAEIEQQSQAEVIQVQAQTQAKIAAVREKHLAAGQVDLEAETVRILNQAKLEALQVVTGARETLLASALETAARLLEKCCDGESRTALLRLLIREAVDTLAVDDRLHLHVQSRDVVKVQQLTQEMGLPAEVSGDLRNDPAPWEPLGGVIIDTGDGRMSLVNTLDVRLQRVANLYRTQIAAMIFNDAGGVGS